MAPPNTPDDTLMIQYKNQVVLDIIDKRVKAIKAETFVSRKGHRERLYAMIKIQAAAATEKNQFPNQLINLDNIIKEILKDLSENKETELEVMFRRGIAPKSTKFIGGRSQFAKMQAAIGKITGHPPPSPSLKAPKLK